MLDVEMAKLELSRKSITDIQVDTAWKWASRAAAAFQISMTLTGVNRSLKFSEGQDYMSEAKEHAAQVNANFLGKIETEISPYFIDALIGLDNSFKGDTNV